MSEKSERSIHRLPPCPAYDVEGMERWLTRLAEEGLFLEKDGFFAGVATFRQGEPRRVTYRLAAAQRERSLDGGDPDPESIALGEQYGWEYLARRGEFHIYRREGDAARELDTDPEVQALAVQMVEKRRRGSFLALFFWIILYPLALLRGAVVLTAITLGTPLFLLILALLVWEIAASAREVHTLRLLRQRLRREGSIYDGRERKKEFRRYRVRRLLYAALIMVLIVCLAAAANARTGGQDRTPLSEHAGEMPFDTLTRLVPGEVESYQNTMFGFGDINTVREWSDLLAPRCIEYSEQADITLTDGRRVDGLLEVEYYETASPLLAKLLTSELWRLERLRRYGGYDLPLEVEGVVGDTVRTYTRDGLHIPCVLLRQGKTVVRAYLHAYQSGEKLPPQIWMPQFSVSIDR